MSDPVARSLQLGAGAHDIPTLVAGIRELQARIERLEGTIDSMVAAGPASDEAREMFLDEHNEVVRLQAQIERVEGLAEKWGAKLAEKWGANIYEDRGGNALRSCVTELLAALAPTTSQEVCPRCGKRADASSITRRGCEHEFHKSFDPFHQGDS